MKQLYPSLQRLVKVALLIIFLQILPTTGKAQYRILCLGNSITQGNLEHPSYRYALWKKLVDAGVDVTFVGSHDENYGGIPAVKGTVYKGKTYTNRNEGHWGWRSEEIITGNRYYQNQGKLDDWLTEDNIPDMVLLHLGTNDFDHYGNNERSVSEIKKNVSAIVAKIRQKNPFVVILLAKLIPSAKNPSLRGSGIPLYNNQISEFADALNTDRSPVRVVDQFTGFDPSVHTYDGTHPNEDGEALMAQKWYDAIIKTTKIPPVKYSKFEATVTEERDVLLAWETASERWNTYFEVQRAIDTNEFVSIGKVDGAGNSQDTIAYSYNDTSAPTGKLRYRLRQFSLYGRSSFSDTLQVEKGQVLQVVRTIATSKSLLKIYPTISSNKTVTVQQQQPFTEVIITIYTAKGKAIKQLLTKSNANGTVVEHVNMKASDKAGIYLVRVISSDGSTLQSKFVLA